MLAAPSSTRDVGAHGERPSASPNVAARAGRLAVALAAVLGALLVWWATGPWGPGLSPDAIAYSSIAESIRDHGELGYWLEPRVSSWPPLYPALLATVSTVLDVSVVESGRIVNAVLHGLTVVVVALLARRLLTHRFLRGLAVAFAVVAQPLVYVSVRVWSEPLFNVLILGAALALAAVQHERGRPRVVMASVFVIAAFTTRYAGLVFIPAGIVVLGAWPRALTRRQRLARAAWFGGPTVAAAMALVLWNRVRTGEAFGPRWRPDEPFWNHAFDGLAAMGRWWLPEDVARLPAVAAGLAVVIAVCALTVWSWRKPTRPAEGTDSTEVGVLAVLSVFVLAYFAYMVWARTTSGFDPLSSRLMLPILLPATLLLLWVVERLASSRSTALGRQVVLAVPLAFLVPTSVAGLDELRSTHDAGNEYTNAAVREFTSSDILDRIPNGCELISNDPWLLWLTGRYAQLTPERVREVSIPPSMHLDELAPLAERTDLCLVWLDTGSTVFYEPDELESVVHLDEVDHDGFTTIYEVSPRR